MSITDCALCRKLQEMGYTHVAAGGTHVDVGDKTYDILSHPMSYAAAVEEDYAEDIHLTLVETTKEEVEARIGRILASYLTGE